jgi:hypothetical protein
MLRAGSLPCAQVPRPLPRCHAQSRVNRESRPCWHAVPVEGGTKLALGERDELVWIYIPAALVFVGLWSGIPMWLVLKRPDRGPAAAGRAGPAARRAAGGRVIAMTDMVSRERATATWLSGVAGLVLMAAALVMMACAAPSLAHPRPHGATARPASRPASSPITGGWPASRAGRAGQGRQAG